MKTKLKLTLLIVLVMLLNACKKNGTSETLTKKLKYLTQIIAVKGTTTTFTDFTYDDQKRLKSIKSGDNITTYVYNGDNLSSVESVFRNGTNVSRAVSELTYSEGKLQTISSKSYINDQLGPETPPFSFVYNGDKLTELHHDGNVTFYYYDNNNNITKIFYHGSTDYTVTYSSYDNKKKQIY